MEGSFVGAMGLGEMYAHNRIGTLSNEISIYPHKDSCGIMCRWLGMHKTISDLKNDDVSSNLLGMLS